MQNIAMIAIFISWTLLACQSMDKSKTVVSEHDRLQTRKQMVLNSIDSGQAAQALFDARRLAEEYPSDASVMNVLGLTHMALKNSPKAIDALEKASRIDPSETMYTLNLSSAYVQAGRHQAARTLLEKKLKSAEFARYQFPERVYHNLGLIADLTGNSVRAENYYNKALTENPTNFLTLLELARIYERTHRRILAADKLETARATCPRCIEPVEALVRIYMMQGKSKVALDIVEAMEKNEGLTEQQTKRILELKKIVSKGNTQSRS